MLLLEVESLRSGHEAAAAVHHPQRPDTELVLPGVVLDARIIEALRTQGVRWVWVRWAGLEFLDSRIPLRTGDLRGRVHKHLVDDFADGVAKSVGVSQYVRYCSTISELIVQMLAASNNGAGVQTSALFDHKRSLFSHSASVAYLSLALALRLDSYLVEERRAAGALAACDITNLGVGAMLHDIGKLQLPSTLTVHEPLAEPPGKAYAGHPRRGYKMISSRISPTARAVVLHHHQRYDGTGFPDMASVTRRRRKGPLDGRRIHIFSRVVSLCDTFEHLCFDADDNPRPIVAALADLLAGDLGERFDPVIFRGLFTCVPPFALGTTLRLSDGRLAAVIGLNPAHPCRPKVRLLHQKNPAAWDLDLGRDESVHVREALGCNVEKWLFELPAATNGETESVARAG